MDIKILAGGALLAGFIIYNNDKKKKEVSVPLLKLKAPIITEPNLNISNLQPGSVIDTKGFDKMYDLTKLTKTEQQAVFQDHTSKKALIYKKVAILTIAITGSAVSVAAIIGYIINSLGMDANRTPAVLRYGDKESGENLINKGIEDIEKIDTNINKNDLDEINVDDIEKQEIAEKLEDNAKTLKQKALDTLKELKDKFLSKFKKIKKNLKTYWFSDKDVKVSTSGGFELDPEESSGLRIESPTGGFITEINQLKIDLQNLQQQVKDNAIAIKTTSTILEKKIIEVEENLSSDFGDLSIKSELIEEDMTRDLNKLKKYTDEQIVDLIDKQDELEDKQKQIIEIAEKDIETMKKSVQNLIESEVNIKSGIDTLVDEQKEIKTEVEKQGVTFQELQKKNFIEIKQEIEKSSKKSPQEIYNYITILLLKRESEINDITNKNLMIRNLINNIISNYEKTGDVHIPKNVGIGTVLIGSLNFNSGFVGDYIFWYLTKNERQGPSLQLYRILCNDQSIREDNPDYKRFIIDRKYSILISNYIDEQGIVIQKHFQLPKF